MNLLLRARKARWRLLQELYRIRRRKYLLAPVIITERPDPGALPLTDEEEG